MLSNVEENTNKTQEKERIQNHKTDANGQHPKGKDLDSWYAEDAEIDDEIPYETKWEITTLATHRQTLRPHINPNLPPDPIHEPKMKAHKKSLTHEQHTMKT